VRHVYDLYKTGSLLDDPPASGSRRHRKWHNLHDDYVQIAAELGFLGLAAYLLLLGQSLSTSLPRDGPLAELAWGIRSALWLFVLGGLFYKCFLNFYPWRIFVVLLGLDAALHALRRTDAAQARVDGDRC
jgi:hypothetical protein